MAENNGGEMQGGGMGQNPMHKNTLMGILAYLGPLVIISYAMAVDEPFVKFHIKQGLVLLAISVVLWVLSSMMWNFDVLFNVVNLAVFVLAILGIMNVLQGKEKELPFVGSFAKNFTF